MKKISIRIVAVLMVVTSVTTMVSCREKNTGSVHHSESKDQGDNQVNSPEMRSEADKSQSGTDSSTPDGTTAQPTSRP